MSQLMREQLFPVGGSEYQADSNAPPITFRIEPDPTKMLKMSTVELVTLVDTNANISLTGELTNSANNAAAAMLAAQWSFTYPNGITSFIGRVRVSTAGGIVLEELNGVNILAQTRALFMGDAETSRLNRAEGRGVETNPLAFVPVGDFTNISQGSGNISGLGPAGSVSVSQLLEMRLKFSTLGGFMAQDLWPLSTGLTIDIFLTQFNEYSRRLSGRPFESSSLQSAGLNSVMNANVINLQAQSVPTGLDLQGTLGLFANGAGAIGGTRVNMCGDNQANTYFEQGAVPVLINTAGGFVTTITTRNTNAAEAVTDFPVLYNNGTNIELLPVDGISKLATPVDISTSPAFPDISNVIPDPVTTDMRAHGLEIATVTNATNAPITQITTFQWAIDPPEMIQTIKNPLQLISNVGQDWPNSAYGRQQIYAGRMLKAQICITAATVNPNNPATYNFTIFRAGSITTTNLGALTVVPQPSAIGQIAVSGGVPPIVNNLPTGMVSLLCEPDLLVSGVPRLTSVRLEYETKTGAKKELDAVIEVNAWRTEQTTLPADSSGPSVSVNSVLSQLDGIIMAIPASIPGARGGVQTLINDGLTSVFPTYDNVGIFPIPLTLRGSDILDPAPSEVVYALEQAIGKHVKRPELLRIGGGSYDGITTQTIPGDGSPRLSSSCYCIGIPVDGRETVRGRIRLDFGGSIGDTARTAYLFLRHVLQITFEKGRINVKF